MSAPFNLQSNDTSAQISIVSEEGGHSLDSWQGSFLRGKLLKAGIRPESCKFLSLHSVKECELKNLQGSLVIGLGEKVLSSLSAKKGIDKWNMSPLLTHTGEKLIPTFDFNRLRTDWSLTLYFELALRRAHEESASKSYVFPEERFLLNPPLETTFTLLDFLLTVPRVASDVETGYGQINTVGFAWSPSDAIAINVLPDRCSPENFHLLWTKIGAVLESDKVEKVFQNFIYDTSYFSVYGLRTRNIAWDTMHGMKVLWPEFDMNLGNVGRFYTKRPYWKDDGKVEHEEGKKKDWGNVRDWPRHYTYNCRDTTGTLEASFEQERDIEARGLSGFFKDYLLKLTDPLSEMCALGMPIDLQKRETVRKEAQEKADRETKLFQEAVGWPCNPGSWQQVRKYLRESNVNIPKKYDKKSGESKETTDASAIKKIALKRPDLTSLKHLATVKTLNKFLSSYVNFETKSGEARLRYSLNLTGTETLRFSGHKDPWGYGLNIQTLPTDPLLSPKQFVVSPPGESLVEIDLRQAESRFVAYDSADSNLIQMLESGADIHTHVGRAILKQMGRDPDIIPKDEFKRLWRQLGKKAGHGLNYYMKPNKFVETVFDELDIVISRKDAELITEAYYGLFPGIPRWHESIKQELKVKRRLRAPSGWERVFWSRLGDDMFKEAFAWKPQHTIPWIMNHLLLHLYGLREEGKLDGRVKFLAQGHDSLTLLCPDESLRDVALLSNDLRAWHPRVVLPGGEMWIPVEVKVGKVLSEVKEIKL